MNLSRVFFVFVFCLFSFVLHYVVNGTLPRQCDSLSKGTPVVYRNLSILDSHMDVSLNLRLFFVLNKGNYSEPTIIVNKRVCKV